MAKPYLQTVPESSALITRVKNNFQDSILTTRNCMDILAPLIAQAATHMIQALLTDRKILACGNGGAAAGHIAPHRSLDDNLDRQRLHLRRHLRQTGACARPVRRRAARDYHLG